MDGDTDYLVSWEGLSEKYDSWIPEVEIDPSLRANFEKSKTSAVYEVECLRDKKKIKGKLWYKVHWVGFESGDDTWEPETNIHD